VQRVYEAASFGEAARAEAAEEQEGADDSELESAASKRPRRSSGSGSATGEAVLAFREFIDLQRQQRGPSSADEWWSAVGLTEDQKKAVLDLMPPSCLPSPSPFLLAHVEESELRECGLSSIQLRTWLGLAKKQMQ
jgi:hypothetical protein